MKTNLFPVLALGVAALMMSGCSSPLATSAGVEWHLSIQGTVTDADSGAPIWDADVRLVAGWNQVGPTAYTDAQGKYTLEVTYRSNVAPGISFSYPKYSGFTLYNRVACINDWQMIDAQLKKIS